MLRQDFKYKRRKRNFLKKASRSSKAMGKSEHVIENEKRLERGGSS